MRSFAASGTTHSLTGSNVSDLDQTPSASPSDRLLAFLIREFEIPAEQIHRDSRLVEDLGLDSLDLVDTVVELETSLGHRIPAERFKLLRTVGDAFDLLARESESS
jgi:acyl carrier protein